MSNRAIRAGDRMAVAPRGRLELSQKRREASPERTMVWTEPKPRCSRVPVVYYLSRNGHLEHPHFMEVPISSDGLYLKDVINRLNLLRGKGMAPMYSWSSKRSYKNGFVWHDLSEDDFIYPAHGNEYVLKGSELLQPPAAAAAAADVSSPDTSASSSSDNLKSAKDDIDFTAAVTRKKTPWKSLDLNEYKVYKNQLTTEAAVKAADASTQTDERRRQRRREFLAMKEEGEGEGEEETNRELNPTTELAREEISPPPSSSSPETLETLIRADGRLIPIRPDEPDRDDAAAVSGYTSGRMKASAVLMHLISCGSISVKEHGDLPAAAPPQTRRSRPRPRRLMDTPSFPSISLEEKEYFSGSLIEIKKKAGGAAALPELKRSSSYNADRSSRLEIEGVRARCIPRKPKASPAAAARKEGSSGCVARSAHGSKRVNGEIPETTEN